MAKDKTSIEQLANELLAISKKRKESVSERLDRIEKELVSLDKKIERTRHILSDGEWKGEWNESDI